MNKNGLDNLMKDLRNTSNSKDRTMFFLFLFFIVVILIAKYFGF